ncbi:putative mitochondrial protein AtMg00710 [Nicotiana tabacum]|uniref:Mitochondrial protein AtMg00710 n=1 Tax=Nicotiana tabacum TaxID=4097 RepID=A0AC58TCW0_TOBAC
MGYNIVSIRSDHDTEFVNVKFDEFCVENGICHNFSVSRTPQQNGITERKNRTLEDMVRTMLIDSGVPKSFLAKAVNTAFYLINKYMIRSLLDKTPYEFLNGRKPKLNYLRAFGCKCFALNNGKEALEFDAKSDKGIFLCYSSQSKAYKVYNKKTRYVEESIHVIFDKSHHSSGKDSHDRMIKMVTSQRSMVRL